MVTSLFATVGPDGAAFDRLVAWLDRWLDAHGDRVEAYLETGASRPPRWIVWTASLESGERELAVRAADIVVCDGTPASMTVCTAGGRAPIVVPRDERQTLHCRHLAASGRVRLAEREDRFGELLTAALGDLATRAMVS
jgi:hypothetical protein